MKLSILVLLILLSGCASLRPEQRNTEIAYQALHIVDTLQTLDIKNHNDVVESNHILGYRPTDAKIISYMAAESVLHFAITTQLASHGAPLWLQRTWGMASIGLTARVVAVNFRLGLKP